jgi:RNA polymerase-interacting CarD/CdnL/TRCF family regulator
MSNIAKATGIFSVLFFFTAVACHYYNNISNLNDLSAEKKMLQQRVTELEEQVNRLQKKLAVQDLKFSTPNQAALLEKQKPLLEKKKPLSDTNLADDYANRMPRSPDENNYMWQRETMQHLQKLVLTNPAEAAKLLRDLAEKNRNNRDSLVVARGIYELSKDKTNLPNDLLTSMYQGQVDLEVKRVSAQVLAQRGDSSLLEKYIDEEGAQQLSKDDPMERSAGLYALSQTGNSLAANAIVPLLNDPDDSVRLDALTALKVTGNQSHLSGVKSLLSDPDEEIRALAKDVIDNLSNLSDSARTTVADTDIAQGFSAPIL